MTSQRAVPADLLGEQLPRISSIPDFVSTTGAEAIELAAMAGLELDPWQQWCLANGLGEREDGKWAAFGVGVVVPRQNGKGGLLEARELAGLFLLEERLIIHSAHQFDTSQEAFERLVALVEGTPALSKRLARNGVIRSHGSEGIRLKNGQRIRFRTRTKGGGRGFTCDCLILDEAMIIPDAFISAVLSTLSARPNPQLWYTGSGVDQTIHEHGLVLARVRHRGIAGDDPSLFYAEWSAADHVDDITTEASWDFELWARANPALGIRITPEYIGNERREFSTNLRGFAVERLGAGDWPDIELGGGKVIRIELWRSLADRHSEPVGRICFAYDCAPDLSSGSIGVGGIRPDGRLHVEVVDHGKGTAWMPGRLAELLHKHRNHGLWCDPGGPAGALLADLKAYGIEPTLVGTQEHGRACGMFVSAVRDDQLRHLGTDELDSAIDGAAKRSVGDVWLWDRKSSAVDISPLVACTLAAWAAQGHRRRTAGPRAIDLNALVKNAALAK